MNDKPNCYALNWSPRADKCNDCAVNADCSGSSTHRRNADAATEPGSSNKKIVRPLDAITRLWYDGVIKENEPAPRCR